MAGISSILGAGASLLGAAGSISGASKDRKRQKKLAEQLGAIQFNPYGVNAGGFGGVNFSDGQANLDFGSLGGANELFFQMLNQGLNQGGAFQNMANASFPSLIAEGQAGAQALAGGSFGQAAGLLGNGFQSALQNQLFGRAGELAGQTDFSQLRDDTLATLRAQAAPFEERAFSKLQDNQFATGRLGSSGGALQTEAFARGLGQADLDRQLQATNVAQRQQQQNANIANIFGGLGSGIAGLESQLLNESFGRFGTTQNLAADLNTALYNRGTGTVQQGLQGLSGLQSVLQSVLGLGTFGANLGAQEAGTRLSALTGQQAGIQNLGPSGMDLFSSFLTSTGGNLLGTEGLSGLFGGND